MESSEQNSPPTTDEMLPAYTNLQWYHYWSSQLGYSEPLHPQMNGSGHGRWEYCFDHSQSGSYSDFESTSRPMNTWNSLPQGQANYHCLEATCLRSHRIQYCKLLSTQATTATSHFSALGVKKVLRFHTQDPKVGDRVTTAIQDIRHIFNVILHINPSQTSDQTQDLESIPPRSPTYMVLSEPALHLPTYHSPLNPYPLPAPALLVGM
jgi:hypothetical protein